MLNFFARTFLCCRLLGISGNNNSFLLVTFGFILNLIHLHLCSVSSPIVLPVSALRRSKRLARRDFELQEAQHFGPLGRLQLLPMEIIYRILDELTSKN